MIYKLLTTAEWDAAREAGHFAGSAVDREDGFIHLSAAGQLVETARRHFATATGLTLLVVDPAVLGPRLRWEPSRGGELFPHLYGTLPVTAVVEAHALPADIPPADAVARLLP
jgi:uncharacterized protein (DUF952 family)